MSECIKRSSWIAVALWSTLMMAMPAWAASFDCGKAGTKVEHLICDNPEISKLDDELSAAYKNSLKNEKQAEAIKQAQKLWMRKQSACLDVKCLRAAYQTRIHKLTSVQSQAETDQYTHVEQDLDESTDYFFHIEPDQKTCQLYLENLNYFAHQNLPLSCNRPIAPEFKDRIKEVEWEDLVPSDYPELFKQFVLIGSHGRHKSNEVMKVYTEEVATRKHLFRRAKLELNGETYKQFAGLFGLPRNTSGASIEYLAGKFFIVQFGVNDLEINAPSLPCKPIRGGGGTNGLGFYLVNADMSSVIRELSVAVKGVYGHDKLLLIDNKLYAEDIWRDASVHLLRVKQIGRIELELLCSYRFETSCRLPGRETFDPKQPMCKPNL